MPTIYEISEDMAALDALLAETGGEIERLRAELAAMKEQLVSKADELAAMQKQRDEAVNALKRIAHYDYRGNRSGESQIAMDALAAMRKGEQ